jgi:hypothetical protein
MLRACSFHLAAKLLRLKNFLLLGAASWLGSKVRRSGSCAIGVMFDQLPSTTVTSSCNQIISGTTLAEIARDIAEAIYGGTAARKEHIQNSSDNTLVLFHDASLSTRSDAAPSSGTPNQFDPQQADRTCCTCAHTVSHNPHIYRDTHGQLLHRDALAMLPCTI